MCIWKRISATVVALTMFATAVPAVQFVSEAKDSEYVKELSGEGFESHELDKMPSGWRIVSAKTSGETLEDTEQQDIYVKNYQLTVSKAEARSGNKSLLLKDQKGILGYVLAESPFVEVKGNTNYSFEYAIKLAGIDHDETYITPTGKEAQVFYGGKVFVHQYDEDGKLLSRTQSGKDILKNTDWEDYCASVNTSAETKYVRIAFFLGGAYKDINGVLQNQDVQLYVDDLSFQTLSDEKLLNGDFEMGSGQNDIYSWHTTSKTIQNEVEAEHDWTKNYTVVRDTKGYHGDAVAVTRTGIGYISLDSNMIQATPKATYVIDFAMRIRNSVHETFPGVRAYVAEYDKNQNLIARTGIHSVVRENIDWTEFSNSYTTGKEAAYIQIEFWCAGLQDSNFTACFDDVRITTIKRNTSDDGINNGGFEEIYDGTLFDWTMPKREDVTYESTFDGYNNTKGIKIVKTSKETHGFGIVQSNKFEVKANQDYKVTYMSRLDKQVGNVYIVAQARFYDKDGVSLDPGRSSEFDHRTTSDVWQQEVGYIKVPARAVTCMMEFLICGTSYECWMDDVTWSIRDDEADVYGFDAVDKDGNLAGWTSTQPGGTKIDKKVYRQGTSSLFVSSKVETAHTKVISDVLIPVDREMRYKFTIYVKSYGCDLNTEGIRLNAMKYDKTGKYIGKIEGLRMSLNEEEEPSNWRELICGVNAGLDTAYVRMYLDIGPGTANLWVDDLSWSLYNAGNEFSDDFESIRDDGTPDGWIATATSGLPEFVTTNSVVTIKAATAEDVGAISAKWKTALEYKTFVYTTTYSATAGTDAKVTLKYYDYRDAEIDRFEYVLKSTNGEMTDASFEFLLPSAKYVIVELSNAGAGSVSFEGLNIVEKAKDETEQEAEIGEWRGKWIWHYEDHYDCLGESRYFRYHVTLPDSPERGTMQITADDHVKLWINGQEITLDESADDWASITFVEDLQDYMTTGDNTIAIKVLNDTSAAALLFDGFVETQSGEWVDFYSDNHTVSSLVEADGWTEKDFNDSSWEACKIIGNVGMQPWDKLEFDASALIKNVFEVIEYSVPEEMNVGEEATFTMTILPEEDIIENVELVGHLWIRNTQKKVLTVNLEQIEGPAMNEWKAGKEIKVAYTFEIPDFVGSAKYIVQLDVNQVRVTNMDIMNNKFLQAIKVTNDMAGNSIHAEMKECNGTQAMYINGEPYPNMSYVVPNRAQYGGQTSAHYMHEAGICVTRLWTRVGGVQHLPIWTGMGEYDFEVLDNYIYEALSDHMDTYLFLCFNLDTPDWWEEENPDEMVLASDGSIPGVSLASEKFLNDVKQANFDMLEHMKEQPYWNRVIGGVLTACRTYEWLWYGSGQYSIDHSPAGQASWKAWLTERYETDVALQKAWNDSSATLENAIVPEYEDRAGDTYATFLDPKTQQNVLDYTEYLQDHLANVLVEFAADITERTDDKLILGAYYGYMNNVYYYTAVTTLHTGVEKVLECDDIDFFAGPALYGERYDGESGAFMQMLDSVLAHGKAVMVEDDLRLCSYVDINSNFYTRDAVGPTYTVSDSVSQLQRNFANEITQNISNWYLNLGGNYFEREQFAAVIETMHNESTVNLAREKDCTSDVCYIIDEDMYENLASTNFNSNYDMLYWLLQEQRYELARIGLTVDNWYLSDLEKGLIPDYKVYIMLSPVELDADERAAIEKYMKNDGKVIVWQYISGASDGQNFNAKNMSDMIGIQVELDGTERALSANFSQADHWLINGIQGEFFGSSAGRASVSPVGIVKDKKATVLGYMNDNSKDAALAIKDMGDWTSIYSAVPNLPVELLRNLMKECDIHMYSENKNDVIFSNSNYVGINCAYGGEKELKLDGTYAVYDVFGRTTYSLSTDTITFDMDDNSTKLFRLTPADKHVVYVDVQESKGSSKQAGYNEVTPGKDYSCKIKADDGYIISGIVIDGQLTEVREKSYTVSFEEVDNSHFVDVQYKKVSQETEETIIEEEFPWGAVIAIAGGVVFAVLVVIIFLLLNRRRVKTNVTDNQTKMKERME